MTVPGKQRCVVCAEEADGKHFGIETCRACAAFFRRTIAYNKIYTCRDKNRCNIHTSVRCMCKSCRYEKCLRVGMRKTAVQRNRDAIGKRSKHSSESQTLTNPTDNAEKALEGMTLLNRIARCYEHLAEIRNVVHQNERISFIETNQAPLRPIRLEECNEQDARDIPLIIEFIVNAFPDFNDLERSQKDILFRNFFLQFGLLECAYYSVLYDRSDILITHCGRYIDINNLEDFFSETDEGTKNKMMGFCKKSMKMFRDIFLVNVRDLLSDKFELYALVGLILFDIALEEQSVECTNICKIVRNQLLSELAYYYAHVKALPDSHLRIGTLMQIPSIVQRSSRKFYEEVEICQIFGIMLFHVSIYDIVLTNKPILGGSYGRKNGSETREYDRNNATHTDRHGLTQFESGKYFEQLL